MLTNPGHEWLTYEVLFNHPIFRRTDGRHRMGAYSLPLTAVRVVLAERLLDEKAPDQAQRDATLEHLRRAFFPDAASISAVRTFADRLSGADAKRHATSTSKPANGRVVLPFNPKDNEPETHAMGAADRTRHRTTDAELTRHEKPVRGPVPARRTITRLNGTWPMWNTASRSCVVELGTPTPAGNADPAAIDPEAGIGLTDGHVFAWPFGSGQRITDMRELDRTGALRFADTAAPRGGASPYFSVKCGASYVGGSPQGLTKMRLDEDSVLACLRSDLVQFVDEKFAPRPPGRPAPDVLIILPEVLSVTEDLGDRPGDGFQVRDLSALDRTKIYFPPTSIPYIRTGAKGPVDFDVLGTRWSGALTTEWVDYWTRTYAIPLGIAKAELLLRYGLQLMTPNAQNFLLEFTPDMVPTGRVVIRDLNDALLHTEMITAMFGDAQRAPETLAASPNAAIFRAGAPAALRYETTTLNVLDPARYPSETGGNRRTLTDSSDRLSYPADTQPQWQFYSALLKGKSVAAPSAASSDPEAQDPATWRQALDANLVWGEAHNAAYAAHLQTALGIDLGVAGKTWLGNPGRYSALAPDAYAAALDPWNKGVAAERDTAALLHKALTSVSGYKAVSAFQRGRRRF